MMTNITKKIDAEKDLTIFSVTGKVSAEEIAAAIRSFYEGPVTSNVIWDFSESDLTGISVSDVKYIANLSAGYTESRFAGKTAIVGSGDLAFGLLRMYEMIKESNELPFITQSFRNIDEAHAWLTGAQPGGEETG